ncbi:MAG: hypothetical protein JWQ48_2385 [Conexibacter sp.]|nr:hypothetical protein [Conexibacter sp.]
MAQVILPYLHPEDVIAGCARRLQTTSVSGIQVGWGQNTAISSRSRSASIKTLQGRWLLRIADFDPLPDDPCTTTSVERLI